MAAQVYELQSDEEGDGISYSALRPLLDREMGEETLAFIRDGEEVFLGIDEHSFKHQEMVYTITEVKQKRAT